MKSRAFRHEIEKLTGKIAQAFWKMAKEQKSE
jgi:hypothetical protein